MRLARVKVEYEHHKERLHSREAHEAYRQPPPGQERGLYRARSPLGSVRSWHSLHDVNLQRSGHCHSCGAINAPPGTSVHYTPYVGGHYQLGSQYGTALRPSRYVSQPTWVPVLGHSTERLRSSSAHHSVSSLQRVRGASCESFSVSVTAPSGYGGRKAQRSNSDMSLATVQRPEPGSEVSELYATTLQDYQERHGQSALRERRAGRKPIMYRHSVC